MNVHIIAQSIYPYNSPRSQRATELAKEFARLGHNVVLQGVLGDYDYSNFERKHNLKVKSIKKMTFAKLNSDGVNNSNFFLKVFIRLFNYLLEFPNIEFIWKIPAVIKKNKNTDLLITIGMPHPIHWGAAIAKTKNDKYIWIADCGDPYYMNKFKSHPYYFKYIEKFFCRKADLILIPIEEAREAYFSEFHNKIKVVPQGFNFKLEEIDKKQEEVNNPVVTFLYAGNFYLKNRNPILFFKYLETLKVDCKFIIYTKTRSLITPFLKSLKDKVEVREYVERDELMREMRKADFLINFENNSNVQSPSKLIDYAIANRPILNLNTNFIDERKVNAFLQKDYSDSYKFINLKDYHINNVVNKIIKLKSEICVE